MMYEDLKPGELDAKLIRIIRLLIETLITHSKDTSYGTACAG